MMPFDSWMRRQLYVEMFDATMRQPGLQKDVKLVRSVQC